MSETNDHCADTIKAHTLVRENFPNYLSAVLLFDREKGAWRTAANITSPQEMAIILRNEADRIETLTPLGSKEATE